MCEASGAFVRKSLAAALDRAQRDDQPSAEVVQSGIAASWILQVFETVGKSVQWNLPGAFDTRGGRIDWTRAEHAFLSQSSESDSRVAWNVCANR